MTLRSRHVRTYPRGQRGVVLFVSLIILLVLSMVAITIANEAILENKMANATRNSQLAQLAASSALNEARARISDVAHTYGAATVCVHLRCLIRTRGLPYDAVDLVHTQQGVNALNAFRVNLAALDGDEISARSAEAPSYLIEQIAPPQTDEATASGEHIFFRVIAVGVGGSADFERVIEGVYGIRNGG